MTDHKQTIQKVINSITIMSFEFDFETIKKEMELQEVSKDELERLGENKIKEKFNIGIFKIKLPNGNLIDANSIAKHNIGNSPDFKYVQWIVKKDLTRLQIKRQIRNQLTSSIEINLSEVQKALLLEDLKNKNIEGYIDELPVKTSNYISEGKFYIQSSCSKERAIEMINEVIEELKLDAKKHVQNRFKRDYKNIFLYTFLILFVSVLWFVNKQFLTLPIWLSTSIGLVLFLIPLVVMRLINHSIFDTLFFREKAKKKYEKEFYSKPT